MTHSDARARTRERLRPEAVPQSAPQREPTARRTAASRAQPKYHKTQKRRRRTDHESWFGRFVFQSILALGVFTWVVFGGADQLLHLRAKAPSPSTQSEASANAPDMNTAWTVDINGDAIADFANPCSNYVRGEDSFGSGTFEASRDAGARKHHGVDFIAAPGAMVRAPIEGEVTRLGAVYRNTEQLRFVEITNEASKLTARVFYVTASVGIGDKVTAGEAIGFAQDLQQRYPGITNHVHVELRNQGRLLNPADYLPFYPGEMVRASLPPPTES